MPSILSDRMAKSQVTGPSNTLM